MHFFQTNLSQYLLFVSKVQPMDDMCVYSRSMLQRLNAITNAFQNASSNSNQQSEGGNAGVIILIAMISIFLLMSLRTNAQKQKKVVSKLSEQ